MGWSQDEKHRLLCCGLQWILERTCRDHVGTQRSTIWRWSNLRRYLSSIIDALRRRWIYFSNFLSLAITVGCLCSFAILSPYPYSCLVRLSVLICLCEAKARQRRATCAFFSHRSRAYSNFDRFTPCPSFLFIVVFWFLFFFACLSVWLLACIHWTARRSKCTMCACISRINIFLKNTSRAMVHFAKLSRARRHAGTWVFAHDRTCMLC